MWSFKIIYFVKPGFKLDITEWNLFGYWDEQVQRPWNTKENMTKQIYVQFNRYKELGCSMHNYLLSMLFINLFLNIHVLNMKSKINLIDVCINNKSKFEIFLVIR